MASFHAVRAVHRRPLLLVVPWPTSCDNLLTAISQPVFHYTAQRYCCFELRLLTTDRNAAAIWATPVLHQNNSLQFPMEVQSWGILCVLPYQTLYLHMKTARTMASFFVDCSFPKVFAHKWPTAMVQQLLYTDEYHLRHDKFPKYQVLWSVWTHSSGSKLN